MTGHPIPDEALDGHTAVLGKTGSGKTSTEKLAVEQVVAEDYRVCVLDTVKSDWWGITSSADGSRPGLPFKILGGPRGHVPLHSGAGAAIGKLVGTGQLPLSIIDMADFEPGGLQRFFVDFAPALMKSMRGVVYLVIEEAHELAPKERAGIGAESMAIHWAKKLATAGRTKGIRLIVATQRIQALHNAVLGSCETIIAHRLIAPADQEPVVKWLKANTDKATLEKVAGSLSALPTGSAWICSGEARIFDLVRLRKFRTYDNTASPGKDAGEISVATAPVDQDELRAIIGEAVKEAEANDPKALKAEVARLREELSGKSGQLPAAPAKPAAPSQRDVERLHQEGFDYGHDHGETVGLNVGIIELEALRNGLNRAIGTLERRRDGKREKPPKIGPDGLLLERPANLPVTQPRAGVLTYKSTHSPLEESGPNERKTLVAPPPAKPKMRLARMEDGQVARLGLIEDRGAPPSNEIEKSYRGPGDMLEVLVICHPWPIDARLWGAFCGRSPISGPWHKAVKELKAAGLVESDGGRYVATAKAIARSDPGEPAGIGSDVELWRYWRSTIAGLIGEGAMGMLRVVANHRPNRLTALQWGLLTQRSPISGPWHAAVNVLKKWDCLAVEGGRRYGVTEKGVAIADVEGGAPSAALLHAARAAKLSPTARKIYDSLPGARIALAKRLGMSHISGPWHGAIKELLKSGLAGETDKVIHTIAEELA